MDKHSQNERILAHLKSGKSLTPLEALTRFGCLRLGGRIYDLRKLGHDVQKEMVEVMDGKRVAKYFLQSE